MHQISKITKIMNPLQNHKFSISDQCHPDKRLQELSSFQMIPKTYHNEVVFGHNGRNFIFATFRSLKKSGLEKKFVDLPKSSYNFFHRGQRCQGFPLTGKKMRWAPLTTSIFADPTGLAHRSRKPSLKLVRSSAFIRQ